MCLQNTYLLRSFFLKALIPSDGFSFQTSLWTETDSACCSILLIVLWYLILIRERLCDRQQEREKQEEGKLWQYLRLLRYKNKYIKRVWGEMHDVFPHGGHSGRRTEGLVWLCPDLGLVCSSALQVPWGRNVLTFLTLHFTLHLPSRCPKTLTVHLTLWVCSDMGRVVFLST